MHEHCITFHRFRRARTRGARHRHRRISRPHRPVAAADPARRRLPGLVLLRQAPGAAGARAAGAGVGAAAGRAYAGHRRRPRQGPGRRGQGGSQGAREKSAVAAKPRATDARALARNPQPQYPAAALRRGEGGTVVLRVNVGADGKADQVALARRSGSRDLDRAAMVAVRDWRFKPATRNGREVASVVEQPVEFRPMQ
ncbi:energy transducer TonB [Lysobacter enzymogenes]|nr:energy transducer TonB [Lysobacter enzymogenes]